MDTQADLQSGNAAGIRFLRRQGSDPALPLVLLHGIGSAARSFAATMTALPPPIDAIAWDAPGYAESQPLASPSPIPRDYAGALEQMLNALGIRRVVLAGHSLGALFAASFAANNPDRIAALALMSPALGYRVSPGAPLPPGVQSRIDELAELGPAGFAAKRAARLVGDPWARPDVVAAVERTMASVNPPGYVQAVRALGAGDLFADAARIAAPAFVAVGTHDQITPPANARQAHAVLHRHAEFHEIPGAGHAMAEEQPQVVARLLADLVKRV